MENHLRFNWCNTKKDFDDLDRLIKVIYKDYPVSPQLYRRKIDGDLKKEFPNSKYGITLKGDTEVGIVGYFIHKDHPETAWIGWCGVTPEFKAEDDEAEQTNLMFLEHYLAKNHPEITHLRTFDNEEINWIKDYPDMDFIVEKDNGPYHWKEGAMMYNVGKNIQGEEFVPWNKEPIW